MHFTAALFVASGVLAVQWVAPLLCSTALGGAALCSSGAAGQLCSLLCQQLAGVPLLRICCVLAASAAVSFALECTERMRWLMFQRSQSAR